MKLLVNQKLATRISIITTVITLTGMLLLWGIVSNNVASIVKNDITNQMTDAVESRASIINDYVTSAEEYMTAFALGSEVRDLLLKDCMWLRQLMDVLLGLEMKGLPNSEYVFLNVDTGVYLYHQDESLLNTQTTHDLCDCLRKTFEDIGRILGEMADGNMAVDVTKNEAYYIGDFKILSESLITIRTKLMNLMRDISRVASQVDASAYQVSAGVQTLSQGTMEQSASVAGLVSHVTELSSQISDSAVRCGNASELVDKANGYADEVRGLASKSSQANILKNPIGQFRIE